MTKIIDNELNMVAGGSIPGLVYDAICLYDAGYLSERIDNPVYVTFHWDECSKAVEGAWAKSGVTYVSHPVDSDQYFIDGQEVTMRMAYEKAGMPY